MEEDLFWLVFFDGQRHDIAPHRAETRQLAVRHGMGHGPDKKLPPVISGEVNLSVLQMLELAEVSTNWITGVEAAGQMKGMSLGRGSRIHGAFAVLLMASAVVVMLVMAFRG